MSRKEIDRVSVMREIENGLLKQGDASRKLEVSSRQLRRILKKYRRDGPSALINKSRGKVSNNKTPQEILDRAMELIRKKYWDFGPTFAAEKLEVRRLRYIGNITDANKYLKEDFLPKYNQRFSLSPKEKGDFHMPLNHKEDLDEIFSVQSERQVNNDFTVRMKGKWYQLDKLQPKTVLQKSKVIIEERLDCSLHIKQNEIYLKFKEIEKQDIDTLRKQRQKEQVYVLTSNPNMARTPNKNHPWKRYGMAKQLLKSRTF